MHFPFKGGALWFFQSILVVLLVGLHHLWCWIRDEGLPEGHQPLTLNTNSNTRLAPSR